MDKLKTSPPPSRPESPSQPFKSSVNRHLPTPTPNKSSHSAMAKRYIYLRRLLKFRQMDFEFAMWQMFYLFAAPQKVCSWFCRLVPFNAGILSMYFLTMSLHTARLLYRNFQYRKPSSVGFALVLHLRFLEFVKFLSWVIFVDCIGVGLLIATLFWFATNKYLRKNSCMDQDVEWGYAFDVHLNAFFPLLIILHVFQLIFYNVLISHEWFVSRLFGNSLWLIALGYYVYITFLGYSGLPILQNTQVLLYPMTILLIFFIVTLASGWNISKSLIDFYQYRVL